MGLDSISLPVLDVKPVPKPVFYRGGGGVSVIIKSYRLKMTPDPQLEAALQHFYELVQAATHQLLDHLWTEPWIDHLASSSLKAYKVIGEEQVTRVMAHSPKYLPSRIRRGIAERVGQVLRSQHKRKEYFYDCLHVVEVTGLTGKLDTLVRQVAKTLQGFHGKYYRYSLIRQTLRFLRRWHLKHGMDVWMLHYADVVHPVIKKFVFPYSPDDGQAIQYCCDGKTLEYKLKLPLVPGPIQRSHWQWFHASIPIPARVQEKIARAKAQSPLKPVLKTQTLKGGLVVPVLQFPWEFPSSQQDKAPMKAKSHRALCVDLGLINLATSVVCEAGWQVSGPVFMKLSHTRYRAIERLYKHIAGVQRKLHRYPPTWTGQGRRTEERDKLYRKLEQYRQELAHMISNELVTMARDVGCTVIILEDLRSLEPLKGKKKLSRRLSNWLRGRIPELLAYKCQEAGIQLEKVNPWGTSSYCPRCGKKGKKVKAPNDLTEDSKGRYFHCSHCGFTADRDYVAALNLYRVGQLDIRKKESLRTTSPILYKRIGTPANRPVGGPVTHRQASCLRVTAG